MSQTMSSFASQIELRNRTKRFGLRVLSLFRSLPKSIESIVIGRQLLRSGLSVGANYREACRARSDAELISKLGIVLQELDETCYWLEILVEGEIMARERLQPLVQESREITAIFTKAISTTRRRKFKE
jgi:four helix bundle protein